MSGKRLVLMMGCALAAAALRAGVTVTNVVVQQRWPWNGLVDIDYEILYDNPNADIYVYPVGMDNDSRLSISPRTLTGDGATAPVKPGKYRMTWNMSADDPTLHSSAFTVTMHAFSGSAPYLIIDLSGGESATNYPVRYSAAPPDLAGDACRTTNLWLRLVLPGTYMMGSPTDELGRESGETKHAVTLSQPCYMGVFEVTQKQWQLVMGATPAYYKGDTRPVEQVSYNDIRGTVNGAAWPVNGQADASSFLGKLRARTGVTIDLPTEAQWEYACRAGTSTALNSGKNLTATGTCPNLAEVGRYPGNISDDKGGYSQHTKVGCYRANAWGLYDMHGNVWEWCLDWYGTYPTGSVNDPKGAITGYYRLLRGGGFGGYGIDASYYRSAFRDNSYKPNSSPVMGSATIGLRVLALPAVQ